jgi:hypothetical protein
VEDHPDGFAGARNAVLAACTMEWFLWIDTDEQLLQGTALAKYLEATVYHGYVIRQHHLQVDAPNHFDSPVRLFRRNVGGPMDPRFYGCIHEQPQAGDCNGDIEPALEVGDAVLAHTGYLVAPIRRQKLFQRNLPLVARDQVRFPDRRLGKLLVARDAVHLGDEEVRQHQDERTPLAESYYRRAVELYEAHFLDPADKYHALARPFYERALQALGQGTEVEWALAGKAGGLNGSHAKSHRLWVQTAAELESVLQFTIRQALARMDPAPVMVDPVAPAVPAPEPVEVTG